jgi:hypothetical protein
MGFDNGSFVSRSVFGRIGNGFREPERVASRVPEMEMIQNQGPKANLHDFNGYALH